MIEIWYFKIKYKTIIFNFELNFNKHSKVSPIFEQKSSKTNGNTVFWIFDRLPFGYSRIITYFPNLLYLVINWELGKNTILGRVSAVLFYLTVYYYNSYIWA